MQNGSLDFDTTPLPTEILGLTPLAGCQHFGRCVLPSTRSIIHHGQQQLSEIMG